jgi:hypothetical protein
VIFRLLGAFSGIRTLYTCFALYTPLLTKGFGSSGGRSSECPAGRPKGNSVLHWRDSVPDSMPFASKTQQQLVVKRKNGIRQRVRLAA